MRGDPLEALPFIWLGCGLTPAEIHRQEGNECGDRIPCELVDYLLWVNECVLYAEYLQKVRDANRGEPPACGRKERVEDPIQRFQKEKRGPCLRDEQHPEAKSHLIESWP